MRCLPGPSCSVSVSKPAFPLQAPVLLTGAFSVEVKGHATPSTQTSSIKTLEAGDWERCTLGFTTTTPFNVGNHNSPDFDFKPDGKNPPVHCSESMPSARP